MALGCGFDTGVSRDPPPCVSRAWHCSSAARCPFGMGGARERWRILMPSPSGLVTGAKSLPGQGHEASVSLWGPLAAPLAGAVRKPCWSGPSASWLPNPSPLCF